MFILHNCRLNWRWQKLNKEYIYIYAYIKKKKQETNSEPFKNVQRKSDSLSQSIEMQIFLLCVFIIISIQSRDTVELYRLNVLNRFVLSQHMISYAESIFGIVVMIRLILNSFFFFPFSLSLSLSNSLSRSVLRDSVAVCRVLSSQRQHFFELMHCSHIFFFYRASIFHLSRDYTKFKL